MNDKPRKPTIYEEITEKIITALEEGVVPWIRPWEAARFGVFRNALTNRPYRGLNTVLLNLVAMRRGYADPRWLTFRNARQRGGYVRKGEKGTPIVFWKFLEVADRDGDADSWESAHESTAQQGRKVIPLARLYTVFNAEQCEGIDLPALELKKAAEQEINEPAERILSLPVIKHGGDRAFYSPSTDEITMPAREAFENMNFYFSCGYHEALHWSGHPDRLARTFGARFGDKDYAFEELVAEIGAAFLGAHTGIPFEEMRHPEYINSWLRILKEDSRAIFTAAAKAQEAADYILYRAGLATAGDIPLPVAA